MDTWSTGLIDACNWSFASCQLFNSKTCSINIKENKSM